MDDGGGDRGGPVNTLAPSDDGCRDRIFLLCQFKQKSWSHVKLADGCHVVVPQAVVNV